MNKSNTSSSEFSEKARKHGWYHLSQHKAYETTEPPIMVSAEGIRITDSKGKEYLDGTAGGVWTTNIGYGRDSVVKTIADQLTKMPYYAGSAGSEPGTQFAEELINISPGLNRVYYSNSGSEANEKAYKMVRQRACALGTDKNGNGKKHKIVFRDRDYHGCTITTLSSCGQEQRSQQYGPFTDGFVKMPHCMCYRCPFNKKYGECKIECATALEDVVKKEGPETVGAVVLEPITAGGGCIPPVKEYFPIIQEICNKYDLLLHIDEVVCGVGRTGKWHGYMNYDVQPDIITLGKGLAGGYAALSVTATTEAVFDLFKTDPTDPMNYFRDISTFGGCTAGPAAGKEVLRIIREENLLENVNIVGDYLLENLKGLQEKHPVIGDVRGKGLFAGVELVKDRTTKEPVLESTTAAIAGECMKQGFLIGRTNRSFLEFNNILLFSPAFICTKGDIDEMLRILDSAISKICE